jgi:general stress protein 26
MDKRDKVLQFLKSERFCVLATADKNSKPEAAMVCFFVKDHLSILLYTDPRSRKAKNLKENRQVSLVIYNLEKKVEIQTDGQATILEGDEAQKAREYILSIDPGQKPHMKKRPVIFILFKPNWIRYCDFSVEPDEIFEFEP